MVKVLSPCPERHSVSGQPTSKGTNHRQTPASALRLVAFCGGGGRLTAAIGLVPFNLALHTAFDMGVGLPGKSATAEGAA